MKARRFIPDPRVLPVLRRVAAHLYQSRLPQMAAALSYRTIFSLIPVLIVGLVVLKFFSSDEDIAATVSKALDYAGLADIRVDEPTGTEADFFFDPREYGPPREGDLGSAGEGAGDTGDAGASPVSAELDDWIAALVARVSQISFRAIGIVGLLTLVYAAISMIVEVERAFNQIYHAPTGRSWGRRIAQYWTMLTLGPIFLVATFYVSDRFQGWATSVGPGPPAAVAGAQGEPAAPAAPSSAPAEDSSRGVVIRAVGFGITVCITTMLLFFVYITVPNTRVRWRPALIGAVVGAVLWESSKWGFTMYLAYSTGYAQFYGVLALIPLFVLWVYVTWMVVLFGLQAAYAIQHLGSFSAEKEAAAGGPVIVDPMAMVGVVGAVARSFAAGRPAARDWVARQTGLVDSLASAMLENLAAAGVVHKVAHEGTSEAYTLARPPEAIPLAEVLQVARGLSGTDVPAAPPQVVERIRAVEREAVGGLTAASLLERPQQESVPTIPGGAGAPAPAGAGG